MAFYYVCWQTEPKRALFRKHSSKGAFGFAFPAPLNTYESNVLTAEAIARANVEAMKLRAKGGKVLVTNIQKID